MKKIFNVILATVFVLGFSSCEKDNYDAPDAGVYGQVVDHNGKPLQTAMGKGSMKIQITEMSYTGNDESVVVTPQELNLKQDGSYSNSKLFAGTYRMIPLEGAFYPYNTEGETVELKNGKMAERNFAVTPYLEVEWVTEPYLTPDNLLKCVVRFKRIAKEGTAMPDVNNIQLYISHTQYCGTESDGNYTPSSMKIVNTDEGKSIELTSKMAFKYSNTYWVRVGACCNDTYKKYNFTDIKKIDIKLN
ncbi:DUF3823 domain-containing protein [Bacteroides sp.]|uniref:DUF3823 domain-containing protein n=1 Tax=Bacteroides sp. TaxID=29523 RepID=UPI002607C7C6|nr:DUF3823 domain-containing protein [Bacteroides sp.]